MRAWHNVPGVKQIPPFIPAPAGRFFTRWIPAFAGTNGLIDLPSELFGFAQYERYSAIASACGAHSMATWRG